MCTIVSCQLEDKLGGQSCGTAGAAIQVAIAPLPFWQMSDRALGRSASWDSQPNIPPESLGPPLLPLASRLYSTNVYSSGQCVTTAHGKTIMEIR